MICNYRPTCRGWAIVLLSAAVLALGGCGRKRALDLPPNAPPQPAAAAQRNADHEPAASTPSVFNPPTAADAPPTAGKGRKRPFVLDPLLNSQLSRFAMNHFDYRNGVLHAEAVNLIELAEAVGTPFYCYSTATLERHYRVFSEAFAGEKSLVCYAMKANSNQSVLRTLAKLGAGADVVSGGELKRALAAGIPPREDPVLRASARPKPSCARRWRQDILCINVESEPELELLSRLARGDRQDGADLGARQSRRRCRHPCQNFHRQIREQVRRSARAGARGLCPRGQTARHSRSPAPTCISAARSPI